MYALAKGREHFIFAQHLDSLPAQLEGIAKHWAQVLGALSPS